MHSFSPPEEDPFLFDMERLRIVASDKIIRRGIAYFNEHRVLDLGSDADRLWASVQGSDPDYAYHLELSLDQDGELQLDCDCPFDWEPFCKHGVAALLEYASRQTAHLDEVKTAEDKARSERANRGRTEVSVEHQAGMPWFGTWTAHSLNAKFATTYDVQIRSLSEKRNHCTCPDFAINRLGTCKHIEAVLHELEKRGEHAHQEMPFSFVYLAWDEDHPPIIKVQRGTQMEDSGRVLVDRNFDSNDSFRGNLPDDFFHFQRDVSGRRDVFVGNDVMAHVNRLAEETAHRLRGQYIQQRILNSGGQIEGLKARFYPYQIEGVSFLAATGRALIADDMGLGKTLQAIAAAVWLKRHAEVQRVLIVCPASLKAQWAREVRKFTGLQTQVIQGNPQIRLTQYRAKATFTVVNYELVLRDMKEINAKLVPDLLILDEAQRVKNWRTKTAAAIRLLESRYLFVLTGTPLENRLEDLFSIIQLIDGRLLGPLWRFWIEFHITDDRGKVVGYRNLSELRRRVKPVMLRRGKELVINQLPDRIQQQLDVAMTDRQRRLHNGALQAASSIAQIAKKRPLTPPEERRLLCCLQQARMACDAAWLVDKESMGAPKLDELARLLEELCIEGGHKAVVFSQWREMTSMAEKMAKALGLGTAHLHGGVPTRDRGELIDRFHDDPSVQVFISTDAGGVGLNLQAASVLINLDIPWNPAVLEQRIGRIHRLGQKHNVQIILLVSADSYEERIFELVRNKKELFVNVVTDEATEDVVGISKRDFRSILESLDLEPAAQKERVPPSSQDLALEEGVDQNSSNLPEPRQEWERSVDEEDERLRASIISVQDLFGSRIERVLSSHGSLLVVVDAVDREMEAEAANFRGEVPVALIDSRTYHVLKQLGSNSPIHNARTVLTKPEVEEQTHPLIAMAQRKLRSGEILLEQACPEEAVGIFADAMLAAVSARSGANTPPPRNQASVWLYTEGVERGWASAPEAMSITKALSLLQAPKVPQTLAESVCADARQIVANSSPACQEMSS